MIWCGLLCVFVVIMIVVVLIFINVFGFLCGVGDICRLKMYFGCIGESIDMIYWIEGKYIKDVVDEINKFMCDWCINGVIKIDMCIVDIMVVFLCLMDINEFFMLFLGYCSF